MENCHTHNKIYPHQPQLKFNYMTVKLLLTFLNLKENTGPTHSATFFTSVLYPYTKFSSTISMVLSNSSLLSFFLVMYMYSNYDSVCWAQLQCYHTSGYETTCTKLALYTSYFILCQGPWQSFSLRKYKVQLP